MSSTRILASLSAILCVSVVAVFFWTRSSSESPLPLSPWHSPGHSQSTLSSSVPRPDTAGWSSWFNPTAWPGNCKEPGGGDDGSDGWNLLYHLGGNGPWIQRVDGVVKGQDDATSLSPPDGCSVQQVHMLSRHAERYPTISAGLRMLNLIDRIRASNVTLAGTDLEFLNTWSYFADDGSGDPSGKFEQLTSTGPYAGTLEAFTTGVKLRTRYAHLFPNTFSLGGGKTKLWASEGDRVVNTAQYFSAGFFGINWKDSAQLNVIPETAERGGDTLTPTNSCRSFLNDTEEGHDQGYHKLCEFRATYLPDIAARLEDQLGSTPELRFSDDEMYAMQEMCGYEILVRGTSPWCDVFSQKEWEHFEYARDVMHYYRTGPGSKYSRAMGSLWLNATASLLKDGEEAGPFFFSFTHDTALPPVITALDLLHDKGRDLPTDGSRMPEDRKWKMSQTLPMGGRIILELLVCGDEEDDVFIRVNINDGIVPLRGCTSGPGHSCPLGGFLERIEGNLKNFKRVCGLEKSNVPDGISFLHQ